MEMAHAELISCFERLDERASFMFPNHKRLYLVLVGGSSLILRNYIDRATDDIDAIMVSAELNDLINSYGINSNVQAYMTSFPYDFEDRLELLWSGVLVDVFAASLEDIVIAKLCSFRDTDSEDIRSPQITNALNWELIAALAALGGIVQRGSLNDKDYQNFRFNYEKYVKECKPCDS